LTTPLIYSYIREAVDIPFVYRMTGKTRRKKLESFKENTPANYGALLQFQFHFYFR